MIRARSLARGAAFAVAAAACSGRSTEPPPPPVTGPLDAGLPVVDGRTDIGNLQPGVLDPDPVVPRPVATPRKKRPARPIEIQLRSTPPGAIAAVDGVQLPYPTPTYWYGEVDGSEVEFSFVKKGHATARYRFVPVQSGVVHARLEPVAQEPPGANLPGVNPPAFSPSDPVVPPPPTVLTPDAAVAPPPPAPPAPPDSATGSAGPRVGPQP